MTVTERMQRIIDEVDWLKGVCALSEAEDTDRDSTGPPIVLFPFGRLVPIREQNRRAFSFVEAMLVVVFLGVFVLIALPRLDYALLKRYKAEAEAQKLATDLRLTRRLAISDAATNTEGYDLNMLGASPYTAYEIKNADTNETVASHAIDSDVVVTGGSMFKFEPTGNLQTGSDVQLTVSAEGKVITITITRATGGVKCAEN
ncbi:MAG: hypothetical protein AMJ65_08985 [Phycisphaerae bacterium SG8_4]|nr:MAG: hypothetical protein AMJ65_08985 [Phycisphaerae bacterium SG8_4]